AQSDGRFCLSVPPFAAGVLSARERDDAVAHRGQARRSCPEQGGGAAGTRWSQRADDASSGGAFRRRAATDGRCPCAGNGSASDFGRRTIGQSGPVERRKIARIV